MYRVLSTRKCVVEQINLFMMMLDGTELFVHV